jgi:phosphopantothenoylcysteine synthetase/decarboxylase
MNILVTSGGTKVPIDPVRAITNTSSGRFGSNIASVLLDKGHHVHFMCSKGSKTPLKLVLDFNNKEEKHVKEHQFANMYSFMIRNYRRYHEYEYKDFEEYAKVLEENVKYLKPDVVILAAAASDYLVDYTDNKLRSAKELTLQLRPAHKLIKLIKLWCPSTFLVGFKLLVEATDEQLEEAAKKSIKDNQCDLVVANDLMSIKAGKHKIKMVCGTPLFPGGTTVIVPNDPPPEDPAKQLVSVIEDLAALVKG